VFPFPVGFPFAGAELSHFFREIFEFALWCDCSNSCLHWKKYERKLKKIEAGIRYIKRCLHRCFSKKRVGKFFQKGSELLTKAQAALERLREWSGESEPDLYFYIKEFFIEVLGYPRESVKINTVQKKGVPDVTVISKDSTSKLQIAWISAEVKRERGIFRDSRARKEVLESQLQRYVTADTVYALLIDPGTLAVYLPDLREARIIKLDQVDVGNLTDTNDPNSLAFLSYDNSVSEHSLRDFREGLAPTGYLSVTSPEDQKRFHDALKVCARELMDYASAKLKSEKEQYAKFLSEFESLKGWENSKTSLRLREVKLRAKHANAIRLVEVVLPEFERQVGKQTPTDSEEAARYVSDVFGTEAASLVLSRIIFIRFAEDHGLTTRKISNGGIKVFRRFYTYLKDDYRWLLRSAYEDAKQVYARLFEESIFDWAHEGDGELAKILERIFYRLNAFNFKEISGDILGNLYEAFLDRPRRKKLGEYYTKPPIVKFILDETGFGKEPERLLDPACGSGSFLVQALKQSVDEMISRSVASKNAIQSSLELIHGLDINVFASFITQLQVLWSLFPYLEPDQKHKLPELQVYGGLNSLEYDPQLTLGEAVTAPLEREATLTRDSKYRFVVGNPPYIRNERLKDKGPWRAFYSPVDTRNSDIAFFFVQRAMLGGRRKTELGEDAMPAWLEDKGILGFVLSLGFANSGAALALRQALLKFKIIHLIDLELVAYRLFDADIVPMLVVVQKEIPQPDWKVKVRVVDPSHKDEKGSIDISKAPSYSVRQSVFEENIVNPFGYFLTKIREEDVPILEKLLSNKGKLAQYAQPLPSRRISAHRKKTKNNPEDEEVSNVALMYGMKLGSGKKIRPSKASGTYQILKGSDVATYHVDRTASEGWINPNDVESKSIWGYLDRLNDIAYVLPAIVVAPIAAKFNPKDVAFNNSTIIFVPKDEYKNFPWGVYLNSALVRFIHHVSLRTTILLRRRCTLYPRTFASLPISDSMFEHEKELGVIAEELRTLSSTIKRRWNLVEEAIRRADKKRLSIFPLDFSTWSGTAIGAVMLTKIDGRDALTTIDADQNMSIFFLQGPLSLLKMVAYLLPDDEDAEISSKELQALEVPVNYEEIVMMIDDAENPESPDIVRFRELSAKADRIIEKSFDLSDAEQRYIYKRLTEYPLSLLEPRYTWTAGAHHQKTRTYAPDARFA